MSNVQKCLVENTSLYVWVEADNLSFRKLTFIFNYIFILYTFMYLRLTLSFLPGFMPAGYLEHIANKLIIFNLWLVSNFKQCFASQVNINLHTKVYLLFQQFF